MVISLKRHFGYVFELVKFALCLQIALCSAFGFLIASSNKTDLFSFQLFFLSFFVFTLACGCAVLNNICDKEYDACFMRTCNRVLVLGKFNIKVAFILSFFFIITALLGLFLYFDEIFPFLYAVLSLVLYNFIYTPLKKKSLLAIVPGALSGMLPILIGWSAVKGSLIDLQIIILMLVLCLWQIPHFFLVLLKSDHLFSNNFVSENSLEFNSGDRPYSQIYPDFSKVFSKTDLKFLTLIWSGLYSLSMLFYLIVGNYTSFIVSLLIAFNSIIIISWIGLRLFTSKTNYRQAFMAINISLLIFMGSGIFDFYFKSF